MTSKYDRVKQIADYAEERGYPSLDAARLAVTAVCLSDHDRQRLRTAADARVAIKRLTAAVAEQLPHAAFDLDVATRAGTLRFRGFTFPFTVDTDGIVLLEGA